MLEKVESMKVYSEWLLQTIPLFLQVENMYPQHWEASTAKEKCLWYIIISGNTFNILKQKQIQKINKKKLYDFYIYVRLIWFIMYVLVYVCVWMFMCMCECTQVQTPANVHAIPLMYWTEDNIRGSVLSFLHVILGIDLIFPSGMEASALTS